MGVVVFGHWEWWNWAACVFYIPSAAREPYGHEDFKVSFGFVGVRFADDPISRSPEASSCREVLYSKSACPGFNYGNYKLWQLWQFLAAVLGAVRLRCVYRAPSLRFGMKR